MKKLIIFFLVLLFCYPSYGQWTWIGTDVFLTNGGDNVKIGGGAPAYKFDVDGSIYTNNRVNIQSGSPGFWIDETDQTLKGCFFVLNNGNLQIQRRAAGFGAYEASFMRFFLNAPANSFVLKQDGKIGFGTGSPAEVLHVFGNARTSGNIYADGKLGIGTLTPGTYALYVNSGTTWLGGETRVDGKLQAEEVEVIVSVTADHVFLPDYDLWSLNKVDSFIKENGRLPEIPSADDMVKDGLNVGDMQIKLLQKIEELTLHMIAQQKQIEELKAQLEEKE